MNRLRITERTVVGQFLRHLDLVISAPALPLNVVSISLTAGEWDEIREKVKSERIGLQDLAEAWRELDPSVWMDDHWIARVCVRVCGFAPDFDRLIHNKRKTG